MLIPSIDLQGGRVVQLVQGDKLAIASDDLDGWIAKFKKFPKVQLIDLDGAKKQREVLKRNIQVAADAGIDCLKYNVQMVGITRTG